MFIWISYEFDVCLLDFIILFLKPLFVTLVLNENACIFVLIANCFNCYEFDVCLRGFRILLIK